MDIPVKARTTFAEYDATPESNHFIELIDGEVIEHPVNDYHQRTLIQLVFTLHPMMTKGSSCLGPTGLHFDDTLCLKLTVAIKTKTFLKTNH